MQPLQISKTAAKCVFVRYRSCRNSRERALQSLLKIGCLDWELPGSCGKGVRRPRTMQVLSRFIYFLFFSSIRKHVDVENAKTQVEKRKCAKCPKCERCAAQFNLKRVAGKKRKQKRKKSKFSHDQRLRQAQQSTRRPALPANRRLCSMYQQAIPQPCLHTCSLHFLRSQNTPFASRRSCIAARCKRGRSKQRSCFLQNFLRIFFCETHPRYSAISDAFFEQRKVRSQVSLFRSSTFSQYY